MAELRSKKGNIINCNILNESYDSYIVEMNGKVGPVKKERIVSMNAIDEAVLDRIRSGVKNVIDRIKGFVCRLFVKNNFIKVFTENGDLVPVNVPLNFAILAQGNNGMGYLPCDDDYALAEELGLNIDFETRAPSDQKGIGNDMTYDDYLRELGHEPILENAKSDAKGYVHVKKYGTGDEDMKDPTEADKYIPDMEYSDIVDMIIDSYKDLRRGIRMESVVCLWGPPGIGKTAMVKEIQRRLKIEDGYNIRICLLSGTNRPDNSLYLPGKETIEYTGSDGRVYKKEVWAGNEMFGIPAYADNGMSDEERREADLYANGARFERNPETGEVAYAVNSHGKKARPDGGIIFIDEFSRSKEDIMIEFMKMFSDAQFGNNIHLGSRWLVLLAANRKKDMEGVSAADNFRIDSAQNCRIESVNVIMSPETWLEWAKRETPDLFKRDIDKDEYTEDDDDNLPMTTNVIPEVIDFIEGNKKALNDVQIYDEEMPEFVNQHAAKANPRAWTNVSKKLKSMMDAASRKTGRKIETLVDLVSSGYMGIRRVQDLTPHIARQVGMPAAEKFEIYLENHIFNIEEAQKVWKQGKTGLKQMAVFTVKDFIIPRFVDANPYVKNAQSFMEALPPNGLLNAINFLYHLASNSTGQGSAQAATVQNFDKFYNTFEECCIDSYDVMDNKTIVENLRKLRLEEQELYRPALERLESISGKNTSAIFAEV